MQTIKMLVSTSVSTVPTLLLLLLVFVLLSLLSGTSTQYLDFWIFVCEFQINVSDTHRQQQ